MPVCLAASLVPVALPAALPEALRRFHNRLVGELGCWQYLALALAVVASRGELPMGQRQWAAHGTRLLVRQQVQAEQSQSERCDGLLVPATMNHLLHIPQWVPLSVAEPVQALALLEEYGY